MGTIKKKIDGNDLMLFNSEGKSWAWATNHSLTFSIDTLEIQSKDCPRYPFVERGKMSVEITSENLFCEDFDDLFEIMMAKTPITLKFGIKKNEGDKYVSEGDLASWEIDGYQDYFTGKFIIVSLEASANTGEKATYSVNFQSVGKITQENDYQKVTTLHDTYSQTKTDDHTMSYRLYGGQINYATIHFADNATVRVDENHSTTATINAQVDTSFNVSVTADSYATIAYLKVDYEIYDGINHVKLSQKVQPNEDITVIAPDIVYRVTIENVTVYYEYHAPTIVAFNSLNAQNITNTSPNQTYFLWWDGEAMTSNSIMLAQTTQQAPIWTYDETDKSLTIRDAGDNVRLTFTGQWRNPSVSAQTFDINYYDIENDEEVEDTYQTGQLINFNSHRIKIHNIIMYFEIPNN
jgi:TP901-1 family phage major tail protein